MSKQDPPAPGKRRKQAAPAPQHSTAAAMATYATLTAVLGDAAALKLLRLVGPEEEAVAACGGLQSGVKACSIALHGMDGWSPLKGIMCFG